ncbi:MAG: hemin-degrading factor [Bacteroidetes bacterium]|nr:hemin-degrading factor [Bacteroidota bacterium]
MSTSTVTQTSQELRQRWDALKSAQPQLRIRDAAKALNSTEAQLLATQVGQEATRLQGPWSTLLQRMPELGRIMALTRNEAVVIEKHGSFNEPQFFTQGPHEIGQVVGPEIDLRLFMAHWAHGYATHMNKGPKQTLYSLQFFDKFGTAIFKVFAEEKESNLEAYHKIVADFTHPEQTAELSVEPDPGPAPYQENPAADAAAFLADWAAMTDTHQFFPMLGKHKVHRFQALKIAESKYAWKVPATTLKTVLDEAKARNISIMAFVGNRGCIEIHTGPINHLLAREAWYNVMDPDFNLHVNTAHITDAFVVEKPTADGLVTSLEFYDQHRELIVQFFGERKPGKPELTEWRQLATEFIPR